MKKSTKLLLTSLIMLLLQSNAQAAGLPLSLAVEAANETVRSCEASGYNVSVAVVDMYGQTIVQFKGDKSTPHTKDTSFRKAYTQVSMGPIFGFDALSVWVEKLKGNPNAAAFTTIPNIIVLPGAVAVKIKGETVAAIGVGGAPSGDKDEACAQAGLLKISDRLNKK